jgi:hypothetical protein
MAFLPFFERICPSFLRDRQAEVRAFIHTRSLSPACLHRTLSSCPRRFNLSYYPAVRTARCTETDGVSSVVQAILTWILISIFTFVSFSRRSSGSCLFSLAIGTEEARWRPENRCCQTTLTAAQVALRTWSNRPITRGGQVGQTAPESGRANWSNRHTGGVVKLVKPLHKTVTDLK